MSKTIKELANQYAKYQTPEQDYGSMEEWKQDVAIYYDDAKEVLSWLFGKPLASRLTAEEKEKIREQYDEVRIFTENTDPCGETSEYYMGQKVVLERIFGKELFEQ